MFFPSCFSHVFDYKSIVLKFDYSFYWTFFYFQFFSTFASIVVFVVVIVAIAAFLPFTLIFIDVCLNIKNICEIYSMCICNKVPTKKEWTKERQHVTLYVYVRIFMLILLHWIPAKTENKTDFFFALYCRMSATP